METNPTSTVPNQSGQSYDPLGGSVNEKSYSIGQSGPRVERDIPEPSFIPPPPDSSDVPIAEPSTKTSGSASATTAAKPKVSFNPDIAELSDTERTKAAERTAMMLLNLYSLGCDKASSMLQISEKMIRRLQMKGEIDLSAPVPYAPGRFISTKDFINEFNESCKDTISVDDDFRNDVMPPLTRVLAKHGVAATDEQMLVYLFGMHIVMGGIKFFDMKRQTSEVLNFAKQHSMAMYAGPVHSMHAVRKEESAPPPTPPPPPTQTEPPHAQQPEGKIVTLQQKAMDDYNSKLSGTIPVNDGNVVTQPPIFGDEQQLQTMEQIYQEDVNERKRMDNLRKQMQGGKLTKKRAVRKKSGVPGPGKNNKGGVPQSVVKKGPGRPRKS